ncbi:putative stress response RCI peptide [Annulohypoxylon maeteangense]|uniref:putative stress response RCI peptide n=1 Tax=Annulohypoxylon maeteangense TaxID=1927788 RepID=UPI002008E0FF|nr:putative stress response RCI peptide [Annulohypoxylon maeteangense]KAI0889019.1 putative stress response RCI peptide [Annulohypoxylon maeteangense]
MCCSADLFLGLLAILFPPLPVWVKTGLCSADSIINILLCMLGYLPGLIHSWYIISKFPELYEYEAATPQDAESGAGNGRVTYVFVSHPPQSERPPQATPQSPTHANYGTASNPGSSSTAAAGAGSSNGHHDPAPPTYAEAVKGDHKVQTQD